MDGSFISVQDALPVVGVDELVQQFLCTSVTFSTASEIGGGASLSRAPFCVSGAQDRDLLDQL
uniref:AlNc14C46G3705 protein n=1 Tax=Albugo laibachii Nc14 TaxID=890382 RepID=F0WAI0_9STRA|nr:AlNc14C46G3705 [Albugo laibachii Nc14]|eukprot:CCA18151.1 AlNc14C46G3705 [Albugo laibachii Nc14]